MAIDQDQINRLLDSATVSSQSKRVFMVEKGNMMTAITWFTRITGQQLSMSDLTSMKASGGFFIHTHADTIGGNPVNVNLRGGSSSSITTEKLVMLMTKDYRMLGDIESTSTTPECPTIDITNPQHLGTVPRVVNCVGRIEFKFATTWDYVQ